jgi:hypothetical protein
MFSTPSSTLSLSYKQEAYTHCEIKQWHVITACFVALSQVSINPRRATGIVTNSKLQIRAYPEVFSDFISK